MKATINITNAEGKPFNGFPREVSFEALGSGLEITGNTFYLQEIASPSISTAKLTPGDTITITVKE